MIVDDVPCRGVVSFVSIFCKEPGHFSTRCDLFGRAQTFSEIINYGFLVGSHPLVEAQTPEPSLDDPFMIVDDVQYDGAETFVSVVEGDCETNSIAFRQNIKISAPCISPVRAQMVYSIGSTNC